MSTLLKLADKTGAQEIDGTIALVGEEAIITYGRSVAYLCKLFCEHALQANEELKEQLEDELEIFVLNSASSQAQNIADGISKYFELN